MTSAPPSAAPIRVDVFSVKGGVGKTTVSYSLARAQALHCKRPVLLIDADLTGTCLGDLLDSRVPWYLTSNLAHLLCDPPDTLAEALGGDRLPVYIESEPTSAGTPQRASRADGAAVVFCPSHAYSTQPSAISRPVLEALIGQETAGGWVRHVLDRLIEATIASLGPLGGVVVDHGPGLAALQSAVLGDIHARSHGRKVAVVTSCDRVDLAMCKATNQSLMQELREAIWIVNRAEATWRADSDDPEIEAGWHAAALRISQDDRVQAAYRRSALTTAPLDLEPLRAQVFGA